MGPSLSSLLELAMQVPNENTRTALEAALRAAMLDSQRRSESLNPTENTPRSEDHAIPTARNVEAINSEDVFTTEQINPEDAVLVSTGHQFDVRSLHRWIQSSFSARGGYINPFTNLAFSPADISTIRNAFTVRSMIIPGPAQQSQSNETSSRVLRLPSIFFSGNTDTTATQLQRGNATNNPDALLRNRLIP